MIRTRTSEQIREQSMARFTDLAAIKYNKGQEEHGGLLDETVTFEKLEEELIDGWFYIQSLRYRTVAEADSENVVIKGLQSRVFELKEENHRLNVTVKQQGKQWEKRESRVLELEDENHRLKVANAAAEKEVERWKEIAKS